MEVAPDVAEQMAVFRQCYRCCVFSETCHHEIKEVVWKWSAMDNNSSSVEVGKLEAFVSNPVVRALLQLVPGGIGSALDVLLMDRVDGIKQRRLKVFFEALKEGKVHLSAELIDSDDFIHCFDATLRAAVRARRDEKIRLFANLLDRGLVQEKTKSIEDYEDLIGVLDDLSYREWQALMLLDGYLASAAPHDNPLQRVMSFWDEFVRDLEAQIGVDAGEASSFMNRIARTGLYNEITGMYWDYMGGKGMPTPKLRRLKQLIETSELS